VSAQTIFEAAENGDLETVQRLIQADSSIIGSKNNDEDEPLHAAAGCRRGERTSLNAGGVPIEILGVNHGEPDRPHLTPGFIMDLGKYRVYHQADINSEIEIPFLSSVPWEQEKIDIAFFDSFYLQNAEARRIVLERIRPSVVILMHIGEDDSKRYFQELRTFVPQILAYEGPRKTRFSSKPTAG
jgi:hypothetical protein